MMLVSSMSFSIRTEILDRVATTLFASIVIMIMQRLKTLIPTTLLTPMLRLILTTVYEYGTLGDTVAKMDHHNDNPNQIEDSKNKGTGNKH